MAYRVIKWGYLLCAAYRSVSGQVDTLVVPSLVGPVLAAYLAHVLSSSHDMMMENVRYNQVLFVYGAFGCLAAYCMPGYRGVAWLLPSVLSVVNPFAAWCRRNGRSIWGAFARSGYFVNCSVAWLMPPVLSVVNLFRIGFGLLTTCVRVGLRWLVQAYYPFMNLIHQVLHLVVVLLTLNEFVSLVNMLRSSNDESSSVDDDMEIGHQGLLIAMWLVLIAMVQSLKESFATKQQKRCERKEEEEGVDEDMEDDEGGTNGGLSFFWLNMIVCVVLGTIAVNTSGSFASVTIVSNHSIAPRVLLQGLAVTCAFNAFMVKLGELFPTAFALSPPS